MSRRKTPSPYLPVPPADGHRTGCKVGWYYYRDEEIAKRAAEACRHNGRVDAGRGYDFGYCSPGSVMLCDERAGYKPDHERFGMWEVCHS